MYYMYLSNLYFFITIFYIFKVYFIDYAITVVPIFLPLHPSAWYPLLSSNRTPLSSCPWIMHISYLTSPLPILFLLSPYFVPTQLYFFFQFLNYFIVVQLQLSAFSPHPSTPPQPNPPPSPASEMFKAVSMW